MASPRAVAADMVHRDHPDAGRVGARQHRAGMERRAARPRDGEMTGAEMRARRQELGLSQSQIALAAGTSDYTVHSVEVGRHKINAEVRSRIIAVLEHPESIPETMPAPEPVTAWDRERLRVLKILQDEKGRRGMTWRELAGFIGMRSSTLGEIGSGRNRGNLSTWRRICTALGIDSPLLDAGDAMWAPGDALLRYAFRPGTAYIFRAKTSADSAYTSALKVLVFLRDVAVHHVFRHHEVGYIETFTDAACMGWLIREVKNDSH